VSEFDLDAFRARVQRAQEPRRVLGRQVVGSSVSLDGTDAQAILDRLDRLARIEATIVRRRAVLGAANDRPDPARDYVAIEARLDELGIIADESPF
jgi:hypothetical protein